MYLNTLNNRANTQFDKYSKLINIAKGILKFRNKYCVFDNNKPENQTLKWLPEPGIEPRTYSTPGGCFTTRPPS